MSKPAYVETAIDLVDNLESLLRVLNLAMEGKKTAGYPISHVGGGSVVHLAAKMAGEIAGVLKKRAPQI